MALRHDSARLCADCAQRAGRPSWAAPVHNLLGSSVAFERSARKRETYHVPPAPQPPLPAGSHVRLTTPSLFVMVNVLPLLFPAVAVTV